MPSNLYSPWVASFSPLCRGHVAQTGIPSLPHHQIPARARLQTTEGRFQCNWHHFVEIPFWSSSSFDFRYQILKMQQPLANKTYNEWSDPPDYGLAVSAVRVIGPAAECTSDRAAAGIDSWKFRRRREGNFDCNGFNGFSIDAFEAKFGFTVFTLLSRWLVPLIQSHLQELARWEFG